jgi:hypothetical protein
MVALVIAALAWDAADARITGGVKLQGEER